MLNKILSSLGYALSGLGAIVFAVYMASFWLKPSRSSIPRSPQLIAQTEAQPEEALPLPPPPPGDPEMQAEDEAQTETVGEQADPNLAPAATTPATSTTPAAPAEGTKGITADMAFLEPFIYDTREGRRNPFKPTLFLDGGGAQALAGPTMPLERFELEELRLIGIIWDVRNPRAMFLDPKNEIHMVTKDDRIGRKQGYIAVIREGEVVVVESTTFGGETVPTTRILKMERK